MVDEDKKGVLYQSDDVANLCNSGSDTGFKVNNDTCTAYGTKSGSYTIKIESAKDGKVLTRSVGVTVKQLPDAAWVDGDGVKMDYAIESATSWDIAATPYADKTAKLYATTNGIFAGYVRGKNKTV